MLDLDNESKIWCFVCSLRCLIYKVHAAHSDSLMLSLFKLFVKYFFQDFFKSFLKFCHPKSLFSFNRALFARLVSLSSDLIILPHRRRFVKNFFQIFQIFFEVPSFKGLFWGALSSARLSYQTTIHLSTLFFRFFSFGHIARLTPYP